jgi:hypothetical protein
MMVKGDDDRTACLAPLALALARRTRRPRFCVLACGDAERGAQRVCAQCSYTEDRATYSAYGLCSRGAPSGEEALTPAFAAEANQTRQLPPGEGYLAQADLRALMQAALDLGWTLLPYEDDALLWLAARYGHEATTLDESALLRAHQDELLGLEYTNWREEQQARNLLPALDVLPARSKLLVWCGNGHLYKTPQDDWQQMGYQFARLSGISPFTIDQTISVVFDPSYQPFGSPIAAQYASALEARGGTAGVVLAELPPEWMPQLGVDALVLSTDNAMTEE